MPPEGKAYLTRYDWRPTPLPLGPAMTKAERIKSGKRRFVIPLMALRPDLRTDYAPRRIRARPA